MTIEEENRTAVQMKDGPKGRTGPKRNRVSERAAYAKTQLTRRQDLQKAQIESIRRSVVHRGLSDLAYRGDELPEEVCSF